MIKRKGTSYGILVAYPSHQNDGPGMMVVLGAMQMELKLDVFFPKCPSPSGRPRQAHQH